MERTYNQNGLVILCNIGIHTFGEIEGAAPLKANKLEVSFVKFIDRNEYSIILKGREILDPSTQF